MKKLSKVFSLVLGSVLVLSLLTGCKNAAEEPTAARICYDNLGAGFLSEADTKVVVEGAESVSAVDADGNAVSDPDTIAAYDEATGTVTAVSEGVLTLTLKGGEKFRVEVVPAYPTDPGNQYDGTAMDYSQQGKLLGGCHDPSLIEVEENGAPAYYIFSTGWAQGNEIRRSTDLLTWDYMGKATGSNTVLSKVETWIGGTNDTGFVQWWAPDIVAAPDGGYWLYTCCVSNAKVNLDGINYSMACIILMESDTLEAESFRYKGVLMQSCIPDGTEGAIDVNSIDPQIIYDADGKMYMAYGSTPTATAARSTAPSPKKSCCTLRTAAASSSSPWRTTPTRAPVPCSPSKSSSPKTVRSVITARRRAAGSCTAKVTSSSPSLRAPSRAPMSKNSTTASCAPHGSSSRASRASPSRRWATAAARAAARSS